MIYLDDLLFIFMLFFGLIGLFRGAAREMLVGIGALLALFFVFLLESTVSYIGDVLRNLFNGMGLFLFRSGILALLIFFGYQTPYGSKLPIKKTLSSNAIVEKIFGFLIGGFNGFLIVGSFWYFMHDSGYPLDAILAPDLMSERGMEIAELIDKLPPNWLEPPGIYFAIAIGMAVILIMFV